MAGGKVVPQSDRGAMVVLSKEGFSVCAIGKKSGFAITTVAGLKKIVRKVWQQVSAEYLEKLYELLPRRMKAVIAMGGGHTKY